MEYLISDKDKQILRETAKKQLELANMDSNKARIQEWVQAQCPAGRKAYDSPGNGHLFPGNHSSALKCEGAFAKLGGNRFVQ